MRVMLAAVITSAVVLVGFLGAPLVPVGVGAAVACGWMWWRSAQAG